jgi:hypothetical protein
MPQRGDSTAEAVVLLSHATRRSKRLDTVVGEAMRRPANGRARDIQIVGGLTCASARGQVRHGQKAHRRIGGSLLWRPHRIKILRLDQQHSWYHCMGVPQCVGSLARPKRQARATLFRFVPTRDRESRSARAIPTQRLSRSVFRWCGSFSVTSHRGAEKRKAIPAVRARASSDLAA